VDTASLEASQASEIEAEYDLEQPVKCPHCRASIRQLLAVRLLRTRVNFTSNLPRRGCVFVCAECSSILPASVGSRVGL